MIELNNTRLLGHRGARHEALENSLAGFEHAQNLQSRGLAGIEFDVQLTADEHLVVFHDDTLQRLCGLQSRIDQLNLAEIQRHLQLGHQIITLDKLAQALTLSPSVNSVGSKLASIASSLATSQSISSALSKESIPNPQKQILNNLFGLSEFCAQANSTLGVADTLRPFTHIELEIKTHNRTNYSKLIRALCHYLIDSPIATLPIVLTSFDRQLLLQLQRNKLLLPIARGLLVREPRLLNAAPNTALQLGCSHLGIHYPLLNQQVIQFCHRYGLPVSAWTVNDIDIAKQLVQWQVDVIITDIPTQLLK